MITKQKAQELTNKLNNELKASGIPKTAILAPEHVKAQRIAENMEDVWRHQASGAEGDW